MASQSSVAPEQAGDARKLTGKLELIVLCDDGTELENSSVRLSGVEDTLVDLDFDIECVAHPLQQRLPVSILLSDELMGVVLVEAVREREGQQRLQRYSQRIRSYDRPNSVGIKVLKQRSDDLLAHLSVMKSVEGARHDGSLG